MKKGRMIPLAPIGPFWHARRMNKKGKIKIQTSPERAQRLRQMVFHAQRSDPSLTLRAVLERAVDAQIEVLRARYGDPVDVPVDVKLRAGRRIAS